MLKCAVPFPGKQYAMILLLVIIALLHVIEASTERVTGRSKYGKGPRAKGMRKLTPKPVALIKPTDEPSAEALLDDWDMVDLSDGEGSPSSLDELPDRFVEHKLKSDHLDSHNASKKGHSTKFLRNGYIKVAKPSVKEKVS